MGPSPPLRATSRVDNRSKQQRTSPQSRRRAFLQQRASKEAHPRGSRRSQEQSLRSSSTLHRLPPMTDLARRLDSMEPALQRPSVHSELARRLADVAVARLDLGVDDRLQVLSERHSRARRSFHLTLFRRASRNARRFARTRRVPRLRSRALSYFWRRKHKSVCHFYSSVPNCHRTSLRSGDARTADAPASLRLPPREHLSHLRRLEWVDRPPVVPLDRFESLVPRLFHDRQPIEALLSRLGHVS